MIIDFLKKKKAAVVAMGFLALIFSWIEFYLVYPVIGGIRSLKFSNIYEAIILMIKMMYNAIKYNNVISISHIVIGIVVTILGATLVSIAVMVILRSLNDFLERRETVGFNRSFGKVWTIVVLASFALEVIVVGIVIAILPALFVTSSYINGTAGLSYCIFFDMVTILVVLVATIYIRVPIWNSLKNIIANTKRGVDNGRFLELAVKFLVFDLVYIISRCIMVPLRLGSKGLVMDGILFVSFLMFNLFYIVCKTYAIFRTLKGKGIY